MPNTYLRKTDRIVDQDGTPTEQLLALFNDLIDTAGGQGRDKVQGIADGDTVITPNIDGAGDLATVLTSINTNVEAAAASSGGTSLRATASPASVYGVTGSGTTITPTGGTSPYTIAWTYVSGSTDITITGVTSMTPTFNLPASVGSASAVWKGVVTDSAGSPATFDVSMPVTLLVL